MIRVSTDGGNTFGNATSHDLGTTGKFVKQVKRNRCGQSRQFVFEVTVSSPIKCPILAAVMQAESVD
jgi:hypothetical protein